MPSYKEKKQKLRELVKKEEEERIQKIKKQGHAFIQNDSFKRSEKFYKYYVHRPTDFSKLAKVEDFPLQQIKGKKVYKISFSEGAFLVKKFCSQQEQLQIGYQALNRYIYRPYRTNLDGTNGLYDTSEPSPEMEKENKEAFPEQIKDQKGETAYYFNEKIRMTNLGYQYDWPNRSYPSSRVQMPDRIRDLAERGISIFNEIKGEKCEYHGEAAIVNFYKERDYMTGHLDDGEIDQINPILSFCFGLSCVFLLGYPTREKEPIAIKLEAGDLMIMSGFSRVCYHGVPRIMENSYSPPSLEQLDKIQLKIPNDCEGVKFLNEKKQIINYFTNHRLNINIRQVYPNAPIQH